MVATATELLRPAAGSMVAIIPIGAGVNRFANDDSSLEEPVGDRSGRSAARGRPDPLARRRATSKEFGVRSER